MRPRSPLTAVATTGVLLVVLTGAIVVFRHSWRQVMPSNQPGVVENLGQPFSFLPVADPEDCTVTFAVIGDYGEAGEDAAAVASLVSSWQPDFIVTVGDNNYPSGAAETIDANVGQYYHDYIKPYVGSYGTGADTNRFFPALGNHDWSSPGARPYFDYFSLPGNERYYDFTWGPVHFFVLNSTPGEPDGIAADSAQAAWLKEQLTQSVTSWQVVVMHHPPFSSSSNHGSTITMQWPYRAWGADLVMAGHDHVYERLTVDGLTYVTNGLGGNERYGFGQPLPGSRVRFNQQYGALHAQVSPTMLTLAFITSDGMVVDQHTLTHPGPAGVCADQPL